MTAVELIESGIIELYCLGMADEQECRLVEQLAKNSEPIRREMRNIDEALTKYANGFDGVRARGLKEKIFHQIESESSATAPLLTADATPSEWLQYLANSGIEAPADFEGLATHDLPGSEERVTLVMWGKKDAVLPNEIHEEITEYILLCTGSCEMIFDGKKTTFRAGESFSIAPRTLHSGRVTSEELMTIIVQRRAA